MNIFAFRLPGRVDFEIYSSGKPEVLGSLNPGPGKGFLLSTFDIAAPCRFFPFKERLKDIPEAVINENSLDLGTDSSSLENYENYVEKAVEEIKMGRCEKIVTSARKVIPFKAEVFRIFKALCKKYPSAFVFFISTEDFGSWIGASPELLLSRKGQVLKSMALAGTRVHSPTTDRWDEKNIKEQEFVTRYIAETFERLGLNYSISLPQTLRAGNIEHIMTLVSALSDEKTEILELLRSLSPTPALCGVPQKDAMEFIAGNETHRILYGGFGGPVFGNGDFDLFVLIRCAYLNHGTATLFAGGGITQLSDPADEKLEIERKFETLESIFFNK